MNESELEWVTRGQLLYHEWTHLSLWSRKWSSSSSQHPPPPPPPNLPCQPPHRMRCWAKNLLNTYNCWTLCNISRGVTCAETCVQLRQYHFSFVVEQKWEKDLFYDDQAYIAWPMRSLWCILHVPGLYLKLWHVLFRNSGGQLKRKKKSDPTWEWAT